MTETPTDTEITILNEGFSQIMRDGVRRFTVEALASDLGMSKKTIYRFFPSKEGLVLSVIRWMTTRIRRQFEAIIAAESNAAIQFIRVMNLITGVLSQIPVERMNEIKVRYPVVWNHIETFRKERLQNFRDILQRGQEQGYVRHDIDTRQVSVLYIEVINNVFQPEYFIENDVNIGDTLRLFITIFSRGIFTSEGLAIIEESQ